MQPVPHLMPEKAATRDAGVSERKDTLRREGHSEDIAAPEAAPAEDRQAVISTLHPAGPWAAWIAPTSYLPGKQAEAISLTGNPCRADILSVPATLL